MAGKRGGCVTVYLYSSRQSPGMEPDPGEMEETEYALEGFFSTVSA